MIIAYLIMHTADSISQLSERLTAQNGDLLSALRHDVDLFLYVRIGQGEREHHLPR